VVRAALEHGSLTAAAPRLGMTQATASRRLLALEARLGRPLFQRTPRGLVATDTLEAMRPHLDRMAHAEAAVREAFEAGDAPRGDVVVAMPPGVSADLGPLLVAELARTAPDVRLVLLADIAYRDLDQLEAHVALRSEVPAQGEHRAARLVELEVRPYGSAAYVASLPEDVTLGALEWLTWTADLAHLPTSLFVDGVLEGRPARLRSNHFTTLRRAALAGLGVMLLSEVQANGLVPVPLAMPRLAGSMWMVVPDAVRSLPRVQAVMDAVHAVLADL